ncbi:hypothetical protein BsWGS_27390 [Bradybaena similaris]
MLFQVRKAQIDEESESTLHAADGGVDENGVDQTVESEPEPVKIDVGKVSSFEQYKDLFAKNRATQLTGVKTLLQFGNNQQRFSLVQVLLKQLFKVLNSARQNLTEAVYFPGDPFPTNESTRNALSKVLENTALFGDIVLRLPDAVHSVYDREKEWQQLMAWSYNFCKDSGVFEGTSEKLLHLMAQEVKIIPKEANYINPFKEAYRLEMESQKQKKVEKKPKKRIARGPRLRHTEL